MAEQLTDVNEAGSGGRGLFAAFGAVAAAFFAALCCVGPLVFVAFGVGAGLATTFEPLQPFFTVLTIVLLGLGFYVVYGRRAFSPSGTDATGGHVPNAKCAVPRSPTRDRVILWVATVLALLFLTFPRWSLLLI